MRTVNPFHIMLASWFFLLLEFAKTQWLPICTALIALVIWESGRRKLKKSEKALKAHTEDAFTILARRDAELIQAAIARLGAADANRAAYIQLLGFRLEFLVRKFKKSHDLSRKLGITALCASSLSSFVTGSSFFGVLTIGLSFSITSVGVVSLAILTFLNAETDAINNLLLAERIRLEISEYISGADSYEGLDNDTAYYLFAKTVNGLFGANIAQMEIESKAKVAAANATDANAAPSIPSAGN